MTGKKNHDTSVVKVIPSEVLIEGYAQGIFPMAGSRYDPEVNWYTAGRRGIIPLDQFRVSKKMQRWMRNNPYRWSVNEDFRGVMEQCAERESTWISERIIDSFVILHKMGYAHSVEIYREGSMVAGVYGVSLRSAFFAESIFQREKDMGKIALYHCHEQLKKGGFRLWDTQFYTNHLGQFGCTEIDAAEYDTLLEKALLYPAKFDKK